jgi:membrane associated rhomboid family serine protease
MLPIRDTIRSKSFPLVNTLLIVANAFVFFFELSLPPDQLDRFLYAFGAVPTRLDLSNPLTFYPLVTYMFLHGGWLHIISNLWVLFIFGDNVEDRMGSARYLIFYFLGGIAAGLLQIFASPGSDMPAIGASGAIAAVMGAYFVYFPRAKVISLVPIFFFAWFINVPAVLYIGIWFVTQLFSGITSLASAGGAAAGGVAWWAHVGGFLFGVLLAYPFCIGKKSACWHSDEYYPW